MNPAAFSLLHPAAGIAAFAVVAAIIGRYWPFYRRELRFEDRHRLTPLDGLRGILCFAVFYHHAAITVGYRTSGTWELPPSSLYTLLGKLSVALFFAVTAFLFWSRALDREGRIEAWPFLRGRFLRVAPLFYFTSAAALIVASPHLHWWPPHNASALARLAFAGVRPWPQIAGFDFTYINAGVTWSLQYEWAFYFAFPALAMLVRAGEPRSIGFVFAGLLVMLGFGCHMYFLTGVLAAHVARSPGVVAGLRGKPVGVAILALFLLMPTLCEDAMTWRGWLMATVAFIPIACGNSLLGMLEFTGLRLLGVISYSVYLLHGFTLWLGWPLFFDLQRRFGGDFSAFLIWTLTLGGATLLGSMLTYRLIEHPFIELEKRYRG